MRLHMGAAVLMMGAMASLAGIRDDGPEQKAKKRMEEFDKDKDQKITEQEWKWKKEVFKEADQDHNGSVTFDELVRHYKNKDQDEKNKKDKDRVAAGKFEEADYDKNSKVSWDEWWKYVNEKTDAVARMFFEKLDRNRDNAIDESERNAFFKTWKQRQKKRFNNENDINGNFEDGDKDKDGKFTWDEWKHYVGDKHEPTIHKFFDMVDENKDGVMKKDELEGFFRDLQKSFGEISQGKDGKKDPPPGRGQDDLKKLEEEVKKKIEFAMKEYDKNADGKLSQEEWTEDVEIFDEWDKSGDGYLSRDELMAYFRAQLSKHTEPRKD